jgi:hypothetical protein
MEKIKSSAELRKFIKSNHEVRYFADLNRHGQVRIHKAYKVKIEKAAYWIHFEYGLQPCLVPERRKLVETMEEAKEEVQKLRNIKLQERKKYGDKLKEVAKFLDRYHWKIGCFTEDSSLNPDPDERLLAREIRRLYRSMPNQEKDDEETYTGLLENYIKHGTIYTQALSFRKEHVVCVRYASGSRTVQVELINGTTIVPKSESVVRLIKTIFGDRLDSIYCPDVKVPTGGCDLIGKASK